MTLRDKAFVVGIGETEIVKSSDKPCISFLHEAAAAAIKDAGIEKKEVDGVLYVNSAYEPVPTNTLLEHMGLSHVRFADMVEQEGASNAAMLMEAAMAIHSGLVDCVLCVSGDAGRRPNQGMLPFYEYPGPPRLYDWFEAYGEGIGYNASYALMATRHMYEYGTTMEHLAKIASDQRTNASMVEEGRALFRKPMKVEDVLASPMIAWPLHLLECVYLCCGGMAFVIASPEKARKMSGAKGPPVSIRGIGNAFAPATVEEHPMLKNGVVSPIRLAAEQAYSMANVVPKDIHVGGSYDCYTITVLVHLEDLGFCKKGEGGKFVMEHDLTYSGNHPWNTSGGQLSVGQPGNTAGAVNILEVVKQLQGRCGARQVQGAELGVVTGNGGVFSSNVVLVLERASFGR